MGLSMTNLKSIALPKINKPHISTILIWILVLVWLLSVWPGNSMRSEFVSKSIADDDRRTDSITQDLPVIQQFIPQYERLSTIGFIMNRGQGAVQQGLVSFKVYDTAINLIMQKDFQMEEIEDGGFTDVNLGMKVKPGETYYFRIEVSGLTDQAPTLSYRSLSGCGPEENTIFYYGGTVIDDASAVCRYEYEKPVGILQILTYYSFGILMGIIVTAGLGRIRKRKGAQLKK